MPSWEETDRMVENADLATRVERMKAHARIRDLENELAEARAQIAAKDAALTDIANYKGTYVGGAIFMAEVARQALAASEQEHQDFRLQNDAEWRAKLDHLKAQIAEYKTERSYIHGWNAGFEEAQEQARVQIDQLQAALVVFQRHDREARVQIAAKDAEVENWKAEALNYRSLYEGGYKSDGE